MPRSDEEILLTNALSYMVTPSKLPHNLPRMKHASIQHQSAALDPHRHLSHDLLHHRRGCGFCGDRYHITDGRSYHSEHGNLSKWSNASPQPELYEFVQNVIMMNVEENEHVMEENFAIDRLTPCAYEYWSKNEEFEENELSIEEKLDISPHESDTSIAQVQEKAKKKIEVTFEKSKEPQQESREYQPFMLVNPSTLPHIFVDFDMEVEDKEQLKTFNPIDTFVLNVQNSAESLCKRSQLSS
ncbi:hypothetical protein Scep_012469 [Stephania cephalantha]|uniref:Uncharacterized protein n=1 Tax=Stephania cephalantha TaxID=152367 RepID=A0AAP0P9V9_9MAGN